MGESEHQNLEQLIDDIIASSPKSIDLTNEDHARQVIDVVNQFLDQELNLEQLELAENQLIEKNDPSLIFILLALKLTKSKLLVAKIKIPLRISVVFAVYKEHNRIKKRTEHPHGEDFLLKKIDQLKWLFDEQPLVDWELIVVDDGCPEHSGEIAQRIINEHNLENRARVLFLSEAIEKKHPPAKNLSGTHESQKGGSIIYGLWDAIQQHSTNNHITVYTDADLSTHLGQIGLLLDPILHQHKDVAIGSRREPNSVVIKKGTRNNRGKLFIYLWKRLLPNLGDIIDTQCGFKAFRAEIIPTLIADLIENKFAFDIELLLKASLLRSGSISKVPIAWIDSEEASTTTDLQPYLSMLKSMVKMYQKYLPEDQKATSFGAFIDSLDEESFTKILDHIPDEITSREPGEFTQYDGVGVADLVEN